MYTEKVRIDHLILMMMIPFIILLVTNSKKILSKNTKFWNEKNTGNKKEALL